MPSEKKCLPSSVLTNSAASCSIEALMPSSTKANFLLNADVFASTSSNSVVATTKSTSALFPISSSFFSSSAEQLLKQQQQQTFQQSQKETPTVVNESLCVCARCDRPICDKYLYKILEQNYHESCLRCTDCQFTFSSKCFSANGKIYCRDHFLRRFGPKCSGCCEFIGERSVVRKANEHIYHVNCFQCLFCKKKFATGDQFYLAMDGRLVCQNDFENFANKEKDMDCGNKRPRTTISAKSLETLKQAYQASSKPARHVREQLATQTGLDMRVVQVWFQNRRAKEKRLKKDAGRRWNNNNVGVSGVNGCPSMFGNGIGGSMGHDGSDSGSNDESLTEQSPLYGAGGYIDTSSDLDMHSELSYDPNYIPDIAAASSCGLVQPVPLPPTAGSMLTTSSGIHSTLMHTQDSMSNNNNHLHHSDLMSNSIFVDINSISRAQILTPPTTTTCLGVGLHPGATLTSNTQQQHLLNSNPTTPLMHHALQHTGAGSVCGTPGGMQQSPLQQQQQLTAAAAAVAAAAAAHQQQQQQQLQQHHELMMMQHHQHQLNMEHHNALHNPFHHHALQSAQLTADSIVAYTPQ